MPFPLSPRKRPPSPKPIHVWDVETTEKDGLLVPFLIGFENENGYVKFQGPHCVDDFVRFAFRWLPSDSVIWAHNGGGFDHLFIFHHLVNNPNFSMVPVLSGSSCIMLMVEDKTQTPPKTLIFMDSMRVFLTSLRNIAKALYPNNEIAKGNIDLKGTPLDDPKWVEYNATDCHILYTALDGTQKALNQLGGNLKLTGGASAMDLFQRRYLKQELWPVRYPWQRKLIMDAMYGGRTEPFYMGRATNVKTWDVNSLYPFACTFPLPTKLLCYFRQSGDKTEAQAWLERALRDTSIAGFIRGKVHVPRCHIPPLPYRGHKLIFPTGAFCGAWAIPDLQNLYLGGGRVVEIHEAIFFDAEPIAREMMLELFAARHNSGRDLVSRALATAAKLIANSWYGKTGQKPEKEQYRVRPDMKWIHEQIKKGEQWIPHDAKAILWKRVVRKHQPHMLPHLAAYITALGRRHHYATLHRLGEAALYCDTDSVITGSDVPEGDGLGEWKLEKEWDWFEAVLPKTYHGQVGGKIVTKAKGFGGWAKEEYEGGIVAHLQAGGSVRVAGPAKLKTLIDGEDTHPRERAILKRLQSTYDKRIVHPDGTTSPIHIEA